MQRAKTTRAFLNVAERSAAELEYFMILARDLGFVTEQRVNKLSAEIQEIARMLYRPRTKVAPAS